MMHCRWKAGRTSLRVDDGPLMVLDTPEHNIPVKSPVKRFVVINVIIFLYKDLL